MVSFLDNRVSYTTLGVNPSGSFGELTETLICSIIVELALNLDM